MFYKMVAPCLNPNVDFVSTAEESLCRWRAQIPSVAGGQWAPVGMHVGFARDQGRFRRVLLSFFLKSKWA